MKEKKILRTTLKEKLSQITTPQYQQDSRTIATRLFNTIQWKRANTIALTLSRFPEVDTYPLIQNAWESGKTVVVPKCEPATRNMTFYKITSFNQLEKVYFGLFEPILDQTTKWENSLIDTVIIPGLGFTNLGYRIGFGGGYYDRFLKDFEGVTMSLSFKEQIVETIPLQIHDIPVQIIVTPEEVILVNE